MKPDYRGRYAVAGELCFAAAHGKEARLGSFAKSFEPQSAGSNTA